MLTPPQGSWLNPNPSPPKQRGLLEINCIFECKDLWGTEKITQRLAEDRDFQLVCPSLVHLTHGKHGVPIPLYPKGNVEVNLKAVGVGTR